jgi:hypothetical protein
MPKPPHRNLATPAEGVSERVRAFLDPDGVHWRVFEQAFGDYDRRRGMSLIFASDAAVRRVRDYPADWLYLSDEELIELSWKS